MKDQANAGRAPPRGVSAPSVVDLKFLSVLRQAPHRNFKSENHTKIISLLVSSRIRSSHRSALRGIANFGIWDTRVPFATPHNGLPFGSEAVPRLQAPARGQRNERTVADQDIG